MAFDGRNFRQIWNASFPEGAESYSSVAVGYYDGDDTPVINKRIKEFKENSKNSKRNNSTYVKVKARASYREDGLGVGRLSKQR